MNQLCRRVELRRTNIQYTYERHPRDHTLAETTGDQQPDECVWGPTPSSIQPCSSCALYPASASTVECRCTARCFTRMRKVAGWYCMSRVKRREPIKPDPELRQVAVVRHGKRQVVPQSYRQPARFDVCTKCTSMRAGRSSEKAMSERKRNSRQQRRLLCVPAGGSTTHVRRQQHSGLTIGVWRATNARCLHLRQRAGTAMYHKTNGNEERKKCCMWDRNERLMKETKRRRDQGAQLVMLAGPQTVARGAGGCL